MRKIKEADKCQHCPSQGKGVFCDLESSELDELSQHKVTNTYKKGQTLFVQGNHPFGLYCINSGNIKVTKTGADGKETIVRVAQGGDILGHRSLFTSDFYTATATALEETKVCFIDKKYILKVIEENPSVSLHVINKLSRDMGSAENRLSSLHQKNVRERLAELLLLLEQTHGEDIEEGRRLNIKLTREEMATMIGTANETLIRFISEFKDEGLIEQQGKIIILKDTERLADWANLAY